jgi:serine phosphatase RsbU (regulator of sigma subunit)
LRGTWLGLSAPKVEEQHELLLDPGDEVLLTTDGAIDQLEEQGGLERAAREGATGASLLAALRGRLEAALAAGPQLDDITLVLVRRRGADSGGADVRV